GEAGAWVGHVAVGGAPSPMGDRGRIGSRNPSSEPRAATRRAPRDHVDLPRVLCGTHRFGENHDHRVAYQGGRLVEEPLLVDDFLIAGNSEGSSKTKGVPWNGQMPGNCFKQHNIDLESNTCSTSNPIRANMGAAEEANICQLLFDNNASANSKLTFLENDNVRENDVYYDWSDISNFEDIDTMFR
ncbi:hypothetical protein B296_00048866, partial [Ensete ventricosum]